MRNTNAATLMAHLKASHTLAADVRRIATDAGVKKLVLVTCAGGCHRKNSGKVGRCRAPNLQGRSGGRTRPDGNPAVSEKVRRPQFR